jgi:hypothetical protein
MATRANPDNYTNWVEIVKLVPQLLWFVLAAIILTKLLPDFRAVLEAGGSDRQIGKDGVLSQISESDRNKIAARFRAMSSKTRGASVLWVHDKHPSQNVLERRVLVSAGINVDLAPSTTEAMSWLAQSNYDVVVTNLNRKDDEAPCFSRV